MEPKRVLIVEDTNHIVRVLRSVFEQAGFIVSTASNGREALSLIADEHFDVMITDIRMPEMDGERLCRHLATVGPYLPDCVFVVTSLVGEKERFFLEAYPFISLVEKPVGPRHLLRLVMRRLEAETQAGSAELPEPKRRAA